MRSKTSKTRNYKSKSSKKIEQIIAENGSNMDTNGEPLPTRQKAAYKMTVVRPNEWYDLLNIRYYKHLQEMFYTEWTDTIDKEGNVLLETQVKVFKQNKKNSTNDIKTEEDSNQTLFNESIPPKSNILYVLTLYHTNNTLLIQGNLRANWVDEDYPLLKTVLNKRKEQESSMLEAYNHVLEIPTLTTNKELNQEPNITSINEGNPEKIKTMIPQIIITPPLEIITEDNKDVPQSSPNPITSEQSNLTTNNENRNEHTVTKINHPSETNQNNPTIPEESSTEKEIILIEMTDKSTNQLRLANEKSMKSPTKQKSNTKRKEKEKPAATIEMHEKLKNIINKIDNEMIDFAKKYEQEQELINIKITDIIENLIAPLKLENGKLKEALQNALDKIELLNTQILHSTTMTKNKVKQTKVAKENKFENINKHH